MEEISSIIAMSKVLEDPFHAQNTLEWVLQFEPEADSSMRIAAYSHDIERAIETKRVKRQHFSNYDLFKVAHANNSVRILKEIMLRHKVSPEIIKETCRLVGLHETGGDPRSDVLNDADSLSFFCVNLPWYFEREGWEETVRRCQWGYLRISPQRRDLIETISYEQQELIDLVQESLLQIG